MLNQSIYAVVFLLRGQVEIRLVSAIGSESAFWAALEAEPDENWPFLLDPARPPVIGLLGDLREVPDLKSLLLSLVPASL